MYTHTHRSRGVFMWIKSSLGHLHGSMAPFYQVYRCTCACVHQRLRLKPCVRLGACKGLSLEPFCMPFFGLRLEPCVGLGACKGLRLGL